MDRVACSVHYFTETMRKMREEDPRRVTHSLKVGFALCLVSFIYYFKLFYDNFGISAMWAIMTVVVVFEFSVGATLMKVINRGIATLLAGVLGIAAHHLASLSGHTCEPIVLQLLVFIQASAATFLKFNSGVKKRFEYGITIFILTFSLVSVSGFRDDEIWTLAYNRLSTVIIGSCVCVVVSIIVCPVWAGQELHNAVSTNLEKLGIFLEGFGVEYLSRIMQVDENMSFRDKYESVLNSRASEETLVNFAWWEPGHGAFLFRHPWHQYQKIGNHIRHCAYRVDLLIAHLASSHTLSLEQEKIEEMFEESSRECGKALKALSDTMKAMAPPSLAEPHISKSKSATNVLNSTLQLLHHQNQDYFFEIITVISLLIEVVYCVEIIADSITELADLAHFHNDDEHITCENKVKAIETVENSSPALIPYQRAELQVVIPH